MQDFICLELKMKILVFGNPLVKKDSLPLKLLPELKKNFPSITFKEFDAVEDLQKEGRNLIILDTVKGIQNACLLNLNSIKIDKIYSLHDFDLGYNLKLLKKLDKIDNAKIIAVPMNINEKKALNQVHLILRKCVAQPMQGS